MGKVILIMCDGLRYDTAVASMGYLGHLVESKQANLYQVQGELPSISRPMYETIHTGLPSSQHGIVSNLLALRSSKPNIFQITKDAGRVTAAAAYNWVSELYNRTPFDRIDDREVDDASLTIQHGRFYIADDYPDQELFASAALLVKRYLPDYLLVHPMGMDYVGEHFGADSSEYRNHALFQDSLMALTVPIWVSLGYTILVTSDHGMNNDKAHGGTTADVRELPLFIIFADGQGHGNTNQVVSQLQIAPTVLKLLDLPIPASMNRPPIL